MAKRGDSPAQRLAYCQSACQSLRRRLAEPRLLQVAQALQASGEFELADLLSGTVPAVTVVAVTAWTTASLSACQREQAALEEALTERAGRLATVIAALRDRPDLADVLHLLTYGGGEASTGGVDMEARDEGTEDEELDPADQ